MESDFVISQYKAKLKFDKISSIRTTSCMKVIVAKLGTLKLKTQ